jgi:hypothetical protein
LWIVDGGKRGIPPRLGHSRARADPAFLRSDCGGCRLQCGGVKAAVMPGRKTQMPANGVLEVDPSEPFTVNFRRYPVPAAYRGWKPDRKLEFIFGCALVNLETVLSWDPDKLDPIRFRAWKEMTIAVAHISAKFGLVQAKAKSSAAQRAIAAALAAHRSGEKGKTIDGELVDAGEPEDEG